MKQKLFYGCAAIALAIMLTTPAGAQLAPYGQDFEAMDPAAPDALAVDGWLVFGNVFAGDTGFYLYGYGPFPAPNPGGGFSAVAVGEGGVDQGAQQLAVYNDYNNGDHVFGNWIEANVFQERIVDGADVGSVWEFSFDARAGNINDPDDPLCAAGCNSIAAAFIKTLDPNAGFATTNYITADMTNISSNWSRYSISIEIDGSLVGQIFQFGFTNTATLYQPSAIFYDNINFVQNVCDQGETVAINGCDSGVANQDLDECTMNDAIVACAEGTIHHGQFVSCVAHETNSWVVDGLISGQDKGRIQSCAGQSRSTQLYKFQTTFSGPTGMSGVGVELAPGTNSNNEMERTRTKQ